jgi:hypothetical protein
MVMIFDEVTLIEIEDYIQALDENVGLNPETIQDIAQAIFKQRKLIKKLTILDVIKDDVVYAQCRECGELY